jgi:diguanylate cyclase (GGDEF)-like protein/PAS domain S-box-containing protein
MHPSDATALLPLTLVVDDDPMMRLIATQTLTHHGFRVIEAVDGEQALELFAREQPNLVLLDVLMPGIGGYETCRRLRALASGQHVPILMLTGLDDLESINQAYEAGATDFVSKPINWAVLGHRVRYMLRASETIKELAENQALLSSAQRIARLGSWSWDLKGDHGQWSEQTYAILGYERGAVAPNATSFLERVHPDEVKQARTEIRKLLAGKEIGEFAHRIVMADGSMRHVRVHCGLRFDDNGFAVGAHGTIQDVTDSKRAEERIRNLAYFDGLTQLPNRHYFIENVAQALHNSKRHGRVLGVLSMDLDQFKRINDTLGHSVGDKLLQAVATRLHDGIRAHDTIAHGEPDPALGLARLGGDEFCILLTEISQFHDAARVARRILESLSAPFQIDDNELFVTTSIGIALYPLDGEDPDTLIKNADAAMYYAKSQGRNNYQFYGKTMNSRALEKLAMESQLRKAIERAEFELHFQPKLDLRTGRISGAEALIRWHHPELGMVAPIDFIPLAEESGLIVPIGEWVLRAACEQSKRWQGLGLPPVHMAVNIASPHFRHSGLLPTVARVLHDTGLRPEYVEVEVTESMLMDDMETTLATLHKLKDMGLRLAIDDFGTGYSSLAYLKRFPLDALKIDRSFVKDTPGAADDAAITSAIIAMAHSLKLEVVAEGVETVAQLEFLRERGCEYAQGYLISRPVQSQDFVALLSGAVPNSFVRT